MNDWIKCTDQPPPKTEKFLYGYDFGVGLGEWGQTYVTRNGNSERADEKYILILWPSEVLDSPTNIFELDLEGMIALEISWMSLPKEPNA